MMDHTDIDARPNVDHSQGRTSGPDQDRFGKRGLLVVGAAAAILSFQIWVQLAQAVGFTAHWSIDLFGLVLSFWIAWLYPIAIDVYALLVTREWLRSARGSRLRRWASANSIGAITLSFLGQGAFHAFAGHQPPTWFVVAMGGMPPLVVGLTVHLYTMRGRVEDSTAARVQRTAPARTSRTSETRAKADRPAPAQDSAAQRGPVSARPVQPEAVDHTDNGKATNGVVRELHPAQPGGTVVDRMVVQIAGRFDDRPVDQLPSRRALMAQFGWTSSAQADKAIKAYRAKRASGPDRVVQDTDSDDTEERRTEAVS